MVESGGEIFNRYRLNNTSDSQLCIGQSDVSLPGYENAGNTPLLEPACRCRPSPAVSQIDIDERAIDLEMLSFFEFGKTTQCQGGDVAKVLD